MVRRVAALVLAMLVGCAEGEYRLPYWTGTEVLVIRDSATHNSPRASMYDMAAVGSSAPLVAAAPGWVRFIEDGNVVSGRGNNNYVWIEHPYPYCQDRNDPARATWPGKPANYDATCRPCNRRYCNEWTVYAHMVQNTVTGSALFSAGLSVGDWVEAGQIIGIEGDIGKAGTPNDPFRHLHWHVARIAPHWTPSEDGDYEHHLGGGLRPERIPFVCTTKGRRVLLYDTTYTAAPC